MDQDVWSVLATLPDPSIGRILTRMRVMMMMINDDDINEDDLDIMNMHGTTVVVLMLICCICFANFVFAIFFASVCDEASCTIRRQREALMLMLI